MKKILAMALLCLAALLNADVIKIGAVLPLSGEYDWIGAGVRNGMLMCLEDNPHIKHQYKIIFEDSTFTPSRASLAAQKLANIDKVDVITSIWGPTAMAVCPISDQKQIVHVANDWAEQWTQKHPYTINLSESDRHFVQLQVLLLKRLKAHRIALMWENTSDWTYSVPKLLDAIKADPKLTLVANEKFIPPTRDFRTVLAKINDSKPDTLLIWSILPESEIILRQARELGLECQITGYFEDLQQKELTKGIPFLAFNNYTQDFAKRYSSHYPHDAIQSGAVGYDQMSAIIKICEQFDAKPEPQRFVEAAKNLPSWTGATGKISPQPNKFLLLATKIVHYQNGVMIPDPDFADLNKELGW